MGSVVVTWSGSCSDRAAIDRLCDGLADVGARSHGYFPEPPPLRRFDRSITGRIAVARSVLGSDLDAAALTRVHAHEGPPKPAITLTNPLVPELPEVDEDLFAVSEVRLVGLEFRLYDGRQLYADDRVSFVLASFPQAPGLDPRLVLVEDAARCRLAEHPQLHEADWYLTLPHVHLRYYCEQWMDWLLAWVKYFHLPDLAYWRYEPLPSYPELAQAFADIAPSREHAERLVLEYIKHLLGEEVEKWRETAAEAAAFWNIARQGRPAS
jgi:hypothetical protein